MSKKLIEGREKVKLWKHKVEIEGLIYKAKRKINSRGNFLSI